MFVWWELFASVKGQAIWISSAREYRDGGFKEPILCFSGWFTARRQDEILAGLLGLSPAELEELQARRVI